jgi:vacuolar-type H+-ATPase subunit H
MSNIVSDLHADIAGAIRDAEDAVTYLKQKFEQLVGHAEADAAPVVAEAEHDGEQLAAAGAGAVETAVTQTIATPDASVPPTA